MLLTTTVDISPLGAAAPGSQPRSSSLQAVPHISLNITLVLHIHITPRLRPASRECFLARLGSNAPTRYSECHPMHVLRSQIRSRHHLLTSHDDVPLASTLRHRRSDSLSEPGGQRSLQSDPTPWQLLQGLFVTFDGDRGPGGVAIGVRLLQGPFTHPRRLQLANHGGIRTERHPTSRGPT